MIDLSKLPAPEVIEELDYEAIRAAMVADLAIRLPGWTAADLESDPAVKVLEAAAYRELLLRQRVNEAARSVMIAFATGGDLDHLAAFFSVSRLGGAAATFPARLDFSAPLPSPLSIPAGWALTSDGGDEARLLVALPLESGATSASGLFEVTSPRWAGGNGLSTAWQAVTPLPWVVGVEQLEPARGGGDEESDESLRKRTQLAPESWSTAGSRLSYAFWARSADGRVRDVAVESPTPGDVVVTVLSSEGDGAADEAMIARVTESVSGEKVRPLTDRVTVRSAAIVPYTLSVELELPAGVAPAPAVEAATAALGGLAGERHRIGGDVPLSAIYAAAHVPGVLRVAIASPLSDVQTFGMEAPWCEAVTVSWRVTDE